jgi:hypothetical protein
MKSKKAKKIQRFKQGKIKETKRVILLKKREELINKIYKINQELHLGRKLELPEALKKEYNANIVKKGVAKVGCRLSLPLCFAGKRVKLKIVGEH